MNDTTTPQEQTDARQDGPLEEPADTGQAQEATAPEEPTGLEDQEGRASRNPNAEASRYRHRLRETETERDRLAEQMEQAQQTIYQQAVEALRCDQDALRHPEDLARFTGRQAGDYIRDGQLDRQALQEDADRLHQDRPELFQTISRIPRPDKSQGMGGGETSGRDAWKDAFTPF